METQQTARSFNSSINLAKSLIILQLIIAFEPPINANNCPWVAHTYAVHVHTCLAGVAGGGALLARTVLAGLRALGAIFWNAYPGVSVQAGPAPCPSLVLP